MQAFQAWNAGSIPAARTTLRQGFVWQATKAVAIKFGRAPELESRGRL